MRGGNRCGPLIERLFSTSQPPLERIRKWCEYVYRVQSEKAAKYGHVCGCPFASVGAELATQDEKIRASSEELIFSARRYVEGAIADAIREGAVGVSDPAKAAKRVYSLCLGMLFEAKVRNNLDGLRDLAPAIMELLGTEQMAATH